MAQAQGSEGNVRTSESGPRLDWEKLFVVLTLAGAVVGALGQKSLPPQILLGLHLGTYFFGCFYALIEVMRGFAEGVIEVDLLMVLAAVGAASVGAWDEGATLLFLFSLSNVLQHYAMQRTEAAVAALMDLRPDNVHVLRQGEIVNLPLEQVQVGETLVLKPGERLALDGQILLGEAHFDESSLTGEADPVHKSVGASVLSGTLNQNGLVHVQVTKLANESTLARLVSLVSQARSEKAKSQTALEIFERRYAVVILLSVGAFIALGPSLTGLTFEANFYRAMTLLTVASPCALVISVPAALLSALANAARHGVLLKGGAHLENLAQIRAVAFDKTGTLTEGKPAVIRSIVAEGASMEELWQVAARAEMASQHPLALAIRRLVSGPEPAMPDSFESVTGKGLKATWDGRNALVGSPRLMLEAGLEIPPELNPTDQEGSLILVHRGHWLGALIVADPIRPDVRAHLERIQQCGVEHLIMLSGDRTAAAAAVATKLGLHEFRAELLPEQKLEVLKELKAKYGAVAMVGDGINDAPALATATVGVAMGKGGTDVALESADVVLMRDDLSTLAYALELSRRSQAIIRQNIAFALGVMVILVIATLTVGIPLPLGVVGHEGSTLIVVANGLRLLR